MDGPLVARRVAHPRFFAWQLRALANLASETITLLLGNGDGTLPQASESAFTVGGRPVALTAGDFNDDGQLDLAVADLDGTESILLQQKIQASETTVHTKTGFYPEEAELKIRIARSKQATESHSDPPSCGRIGPPTRLEGWVLLLP